MPLADVDPDERCAAVPLDGLVAPRVLALFRHSHRRPREVAETFAAIVLAVADRIDDTSRV